MKACSDKPVRGRGRDRERVPIGVRGLRSAFPITVMEALIDVMFSLDSQLLIMEIVDVTAIKLQLGCCYVLCYTPFKVYVASSK